jgi:exopolyphosphatase / guanosine-5'-triphosphate,3'-diphosphate pyrophosphatase
MIWKTTSSDHGKPYMRVAAIDIGSNSIRLLVADVDERGGHDGALETVARAGEVCRLARGLDQAGTIEEELAQRVGGLAAGFVRRALSMGAKHIVIGATAAIRNARNGTEVAGIVEDRSGLPVRILTGNDEARLVYHSVVLGLGRRAAHSACIAFDIGGGSTEVVSGVGAQAGRWASLPFGAVSLTERFLHSDPPDPGEITALEAEVQAGIMHHCALMPEKVPLLVGVGGTVTVLASMDRQLESYDPALLEGWSIRPERLSGLVERLSRSRHEDRRTLTTVGEGRADIVVAGALVVALLVRRFPSSVLVCSTQGLRYGLVRLAAEEFLARRQLPADTEPPGQGPGAWPRRAVVEPGPPRPRTHPRGRR